MGSTLDSSLGSVSAGDGFGASGQLSKNGDYLGSTHVDTGGTNAGQVAVFYNSSLTPEEGGGGGEEVVVAMEN